MRMIQRSLIQLLERSGPICGTAAVGFALWPDRDMQSQGAALAAAHQADVDPRQLSLLD